MKKAVLVLIMIFALFSCAKQDNAQKSGYLAKVGNTKITQADLDKLYQSLPDYAQQIYQGEQGKAKILEELINKEILFQEAVKKGMDRNPDFIKVMEEYKKVSLAQELLEKEIISAAEVSEKDAKDFYDKNKSQFSSISQLKASHILVKTEDEANKVLARLEKGEKFEKIAKAVSIDKESAVNGGDLGFFSKGDMVPEFERAVSTLKKGDISVPVKTKFGYHIIMLTGIKEGPVIEYDKVKEIIIQKLSGDKQKEVFENYMTELRKKHKVEINKDALPKNPQAEPQAEPQEETKPEPQAETKAEPKAEPATPSYPEETTKK